MLKIYGVTTVMNEGYEDGRESKTELFTSLKDQLKYAYSEYKKWFEFIAKDGVDENGRTLKSYEDFIPEVANSGGYIVIQHIAYHLQVELFTAEVAEGDGT